MSYLCYLLCINSPNGIDLSFCQAKNSWFFNHQKHLTEFDNIMNSAKSLKFACCQCIARYDMIENVKPVVDLLPLKIIELLLLELDEFQFSQFHCFFATGADAEYLFVQKYKNLAQANKLKFKKHWSRVVAYNEFEYYCDKYWQTRFTAALRDGSNRQNARLVELCTKVPHLIKRLKTTSANWNIATLKLLSLLPNVKSIKLKGNSNTILASLLPRCKHWKSLASIKLCISRKNINWLPPLKDLLDYKIAQNKSIVFTIYYNGIGLRFPSNMFSFLGETIHGMSGLKMSLGFVNRKLCLAPYSRVECIKELKITHNERNEETLLEVIRYAPQCTDLNNAISKLHLQIFSISRQSCRAFQHWRFSRLETFCLENGSLGHDEAALLTEHASFWPFIRRFTLRFCKIPHSGFLLLLSAMVRGRGCENLVELNLMWHDTITLETFNDFLSSDNLIKLKVVTLKGPLDTVTSLPSQFLSNIRKIPLVYLNMWSFRLEIEQVYQIVCSMFSKSDVHQREMIIRAVPYTAENPQKPLVALNALLAKNSIPCIKRVQVEAIANRILRIGHAGNSEH